MPNQARFLAGLVLAIVLIVGISAGQALYQSYMGPAPGQDRMLKLGRSTYTLEVAGDDAAQQRGLGGRTGLAAKAGMLFVFDGKQERCMWMKDMRFNIDIIWTNRQKQITQIKSDLSPATYPETYCGDAQYVIELPAGTAAKFHLADGRSLDF